MQAGGVSILRKMLADNAGICDATTADCFCIPSRIIYFNTAKIGFYVALYVPAEHIAS